MNPIKLCSFNDSLIIVIERLNFIGNEWPIAIMHIKLTNKISMSILKNNLQVKICQSVDRGWCLTVRHFPWRNSEKKTMVIII